MLGLFETLSTMVAWTLPFSIASTTVWVTMKVDGWLKVMMVVCRLLECAESVVFSFKFWKLTRLIDKKFNVSDGKLEEGEKWSGY